MDEKFPVFDIPVDYLVGKDMAPEILELYRKFPCKMKSSFFFMCTGGELTATINFSDYRVKKGDFIFLIPESFIQLHSFSPDLNFYFAGFSSSFLESVNMIRSTFEFIPVISQNPVLTLSEEVFGIFIDYFEWLMKASYSQQLLFNLEVKKSIFNIWLEQVDDLYNRRYSMDNAPRSRENDIYIEFIVLLHRHYSTEHRVSFYAEKIGVTAQHFCTTIKKTTGRKASEIIMKFLLMEAKSRLKFTQLPVKNISLDLGFATTTFFYKWFKHNTGLTPLEYRNC